MSDNVYKTVEITGSSKTSIEDAVKKAIGRTGESVDRLGWLEVSDIRGHIENGDIAHWQVTTKVGFTLED